MLLVGVDAAKSSYEAALFARANVVGVAVGHKVVRGRETDERCVVVFVERKWPEARLRRRDIVPRDLGGVRTDVVETGRFHALRLLEPKAVDRTRKIRPGPGRSGWWRTAGAVRSSCRTITSSRMRTTGIRAT